MEKMLSRWLKKQVESENFLHYRRLNWKHVALPIIHLEFETFINESKKLASPLTFYLTDHPAVNEGLIQISTTQRPTGTLATFNNEFGIEKVDRGTLKFENGGSLAASQTVWGTVNFVITPCESERLTSNQKEFIIYFNLDPNEVTPQLVRKVIKKYLLLIRVTSLFCMHDSSSWSDRFHYFLIRVLDVRAKVNFQRDILTLKSEWVKKIVVPIVFGLLGILLGVLAPDLVKVFK
ncbi:hypothetical protein [Undibacterium sp.]|uniref:hypothetical protein n=1 Tax=Undibacterium sp. TaxID=1914977 RepID=UPI0037533661